MTEFDAMQLLRTVERPGGVRETLISQQQEKVIRTVLVRVQDATSLSGAISGHSLRQPPLAEEERPLADFNTVHFL